MKRFKHFLIGAVAVLAPAVPAVFASPAVHHFITSHPADAVYFPIIAGVVVDVFHRLFPTKPA